MTKRVWLIMATGLLTLGLIGPQALAGPSGSTRSISPRQLLARGPLPKDSARYARDKAQANRAAAALAADRPAPRVAPKNPVNFTEWEGVKQANVTPSDSTGAIGPTRYIELVNEVFGIYDRGTNLLSTGSLNVLGGRPLTESVFDPQVIWDPTTQRFYYAMDAVVGNFTNSQLAYGWSKTDSPTTAADWCHFVFDYQGDLLPDYPKLGDSQDWGLVGVNTFDPPGFGFVGADVMWFRKPPPGQNCTQPFAGTTRNLKDQNGTSASTPVPAQSTDRPQLTLDGAIVSAADDPGEHNFLTRFTVRNGLAGPIIENPGKSIPIATWSVPPSADQPGLSASIDTLDGRLTQAVSAVDPQFQNKTVVWTQQTVFGGGGSEVRWYEVDPINQLILQSGAATAPSLDVFNGAIAPDRANDGSTQAFGSNMVMGFNTSSSVEFTKIQMISKLGLGPQSPFVLVEASPGLDFDFSCCPNRWGDYAAATPDPAAPQTAPTGQVWLTSMYNKASQSGNSDADWQTRNWGATP